MDEEGSPPYRDEFFEDPDRSHVDPATALDDGGEYIPDDDATVEKEIQEELKENQRYIFERVHFKCVEELQKETSDRPMLAFLYAFKRRVDNPELEMAWADTLNPQKSNHERAEAFITFARILFKRALETLPELTISMWLCIVADPTSFVPFLRVLAGTSLEKMSRQFSDGKAVKLVSDADIASRLGFLPDQFIEGELEGFKVFDSYDGRTGVSVGGIVAGAAGLDAAFVFVSFGPQSDRNYLMFFMLYDSSRNLLNTAISGERRTNIARMLRQIVGAGSLPRANPFVAVADHWWLRRNDSETLLEITFGFAMGWTLASLLSGPTQSLFDRRGEVIIMLLKQIFRIFSFLVAHNTAPTSLSSQFFIVLREPQIVNSTLQIVGTWTPDIYYGASDPCSACPEERRASEHKAIMKNAIDTVFDECLGAFKALCDEWNAAETYAGIEEARKVIEAQSRLIWTKYTAFTNLFEEMLKHPSLAQLDPESESKLARQMWTIAETE